MIKLENLLQENERIAEYGLTSEYVARHCIAKVGSTDISAALESTLHRILDAGGTEDDVFRIMGATIPTEEEREELKEYDEFTDIDLGYVLPGLMVCWDN